MYGKATILPIHINDVDFYMPFVQEYIKSALEHTDGEISFENVLSGIANQERQLWVIKYDGQYIAALVTQIYSYPTNVKIGEITIAGGKDHALWDHFVDVVGKWFKEQKCDFIDIIGRPGWQRLYKKRGFKTAYVNLRKPL